MVTTAYTGPSDAVARALTARPDGVAAFLTPFDGQAPILASLAGEARPAPPPPLGPEPQRPDAARHAGRAPRRRGHHHVAAVVSAESRAAVTSNGAGAPPFPRLRRSLAGDPVVIGYHNSMEAILTALERVRGGDVEERVETELERARLDLPGGRVTLDRNRQAVRDGYLSRIVAHGGKPTLEPVRGRPARRADLRGSPLVGSAAGPRDAAVPTGLAARLGAVAAQPAIVQVKRVSLSRGARPPGRTPRRTSTAGVVVCVASAVRARPSPSRRQRSVRPTTIDAGAARRIDERRRVGLDEDGLGGHAERALHGDGRVGQEPAGVAPVRARRRPCEPKRPVTGACEPGTELDGGPVVLGTGKRHEDRPRARRLVPDHDTDVARCLVEQREHPGVLEQAIRCIHQEEVDVVLAREPRHVHAGGDRREDRGTCLDAVRDQPRAEVVRKRGGGPELAATSRRSSSRGARVEALA